ncbi:hypothetical protein BDZ89DRAFT_747330 [Hymenopellis radicata]|nr:hypothetical protein BDZ89DRAFT_747330 [Hymenopellis radicata]
MRNGLEGGVIAGGVILGEPLSETPSWVEEARNLVEPIARDISHETSSLHGAFSFTWEQVSAMAAEVLPIAEQARCLQELRQHCATYGEGAYIEYSADDVLTFLRRETLPPYASPEMPPGPYDDEDSEQDEDSDYT